MASVDGSFSASFFRAPLLGNSHFEVARIGDPFFSGKLQDRYEQFAATLPPQVERAMKTRYPGSNVTAITIVGSAASFRHYNDIDINVLATGNIRARYSAPNFPKAFKVADEKHHSILKTVEIFPYSAGRLTANEYANFFFSKPVLFGTVPDLFADQVPFFLGGAYRGALVKFNARISMGKLRKATHALANACRHTYTIYGLSGRPLPSDFPYVVKTLYMMDVQGNHNSVPLQYMYEAISGWDVSTPEVNVK